jgi:hypothetical protein
MSQPEDTGGHRPTTAAPPDTARVAGAVGRVSGSCGMALTCGKLAALPQPLPSLLRSGAAPVEVSAEMGVAVDGLGPVVRLASAEAADDPKAQSCLTGGRNPVSAAERHLSAQAIRCAEGTGHRPQRMQLWLRQSTTWPVRTAPASRAADGQSADRSGSLQLPLLFSRPALRAAACGSHPRAGSARTVAGHQGRPSTQRSQGTALQVAEAGECTQSWCAFGSL